MRMRYVGCCRRMLMRRTCAPMRRRPERWGSPEFRFSCWPDAMACPVLNPRSSCCAPSRPRGRHFPNLRLDGDDDRLGGGLVAGFGNAAHGNEHVGFGVIGSGTASGHRVRDHLEAFGSPSFALEMAHEVDPLALLQPASLHVVGVEKNNASPFGNAAVAIVLAIDGRIELVMTANGRQEQLAVGKLVSRYRVNGKTCAAGGGRKLAFARGVGQVEPAGLTHPLIVWGESGHDVFDVLADTVVILDETLPIDGGAAVQRGARHLGDDGRLAAKLLGSRRQNAA